MTSTVYPLLPEAQETPNSKGPNQQTAGLPPSWPHSLQDADVVFHRGRVGRLPVLLEPDHQNVGLHSPETRGLQRVWG